MNQSPPPPKDQQNDQNQNSGGKQSEKEVLFSRIQSSNPLTTLEKNNLVSEENSYLANDQIEKQRYLALPSEFNQVNKDIASAPLVPEVRINTTSSRQMITPTRQNISNLHHGVNSHSQLSTASNNILNIINQNNLQNTQILQLEMVNSEDPSVQMINQNFDFMMSNDDRKEIARIIKQNDYKMQLQNKQKIKLYNQILGTPKRDNNKLTAMKNEMFQQRAEELQKKYENMDLEFVQSQKTLIECGGITVDSQQIQSENRFKNNIMEFNNNNNFWSRTRVNNRATSAVTYNNPRRLHYQTQDYNRKQKGFKNVMKSTAAKKKYGIGKTKKSVQEYKSTEGYQFENNTARTTEFGANADTNRLTDSKASKGSNIIDTNIKDVVGQIKVIDQSFEQIDRLGKQHLTNYFTDGKMKRSISDIKVKNYTSDYGQNKTYTALKTGNYQDLAESKLSLSKKGRPFSKSIGKKKSGTKTQTQTKLRLGPESDDNDDVSQSYAQSCNQVLNPKWRVQQFNCANQQKCNQDIQSETYLSQSGSHNKKLSNKQSQKRAQKYVTQKRFNSKNDRILQFQESQKHRDSSSNIREQVPSHTKVVHNPTAIPSSGTSIFKNKTSRLNMKLYQVPSQNQRSLQTKDQRQQTIRSINMLENLKKPPRKKTAVNSNMINRPGQVITAKTRHENQQSLNPLNNLLIQQVKPDINFKYIQQPKQWTQAPSISVGENLRIEPGVQKSFSPKSATMNQRQMTGNKKRKLLASPKFSNECDPAAEMIDRAQFKQYREMDPQKKASFQKFIQRFQRSLSNEKQIKEIKARQAQIILNQHLASFQAQHPVQSNPVIYQGHFIPSPNALNSPGFNKNNSNIIISDNFGALITKSPESISPSSAYRGTILGPASHRKTTGGLQPVDNNQLNGVQQFQQFSMGQIPYQNYSPTSHLNHSNLFPSQVGDQKYKESQSFKFDQDSRCRPETILQQIEQYDYEKKRHESLAQLQKQLLNKQIELNNQRSKLPRELMKSEEELIQRNLLQLQSQINENKTISLAYLNAKEGAFGDLVNDNYKVSELGNPLTNKNNPENLQSFAIDSQIDLNGAQIFTIENIINGNSFDAFEIQNSRSRQPIMVNANSHYHLSQPQIMRKENETADEGRNEAYNDIVKQLHTPSSATLRRSAIIKNKGKLNQDLNLSQGSKTQQSESQLKNNSEILLQKKSRQTFKDFYKENLSLSADFNAHTKFKNNQNATCDLKEELSKIDPTNQSQLLLLPGQLPAASLEEGTSDHCSSGSKPSQLRQSKNSSQLTFDKQNIQLNPSAKFNNVGSNEEDESIIPMPIIIKTAYTDQYSGIDSKTYNDNLQMIINQQKKRINNSENYSFEEQFGILQLNTQQEMGGGSQSFGSQPDVLNELAKSQINYANYHQNLFYIQKLQELQIQHLQDQLKLQEKKSMKVKTFDCPLPQLEDEINKTKTITKKTTAPRSLSNTELNDDIYQPKIIKNIDITRKISNNSKQRKAQNLQLTSQRILSDAELTQKQQTLSSNNIKQKPKQYGHYSAVQRSQTRRSNSPIFQKGMIRPKSVKSRHAFPQKNILTSLASSNKCRQMKKNNVNYHLMKSRDYVMHQDQQDLPFEEVKNFDRFGNLKDNVYSVLKQDRYQSKGKNALLQNQNFRDLNMKLQQRRQKNTSDNAKKRKSPDKSDHIDTQRDNAFDLVYGNHLEITNRNMNGQQCETIQLQNQTSPFVDSRLMSPDHKEKEEAALGSTAKRERSKQQQFNLIELTSSGDNEINDRSQDHSDFIQPASQYKIRTFYVNQQQ